MLTRSTIREVRLALQDERAQSPRVQVSSIHAMKIKYFQDTDTLYIEFRAAEVAETKELDDNTLLYLHRNGTFAP
jgi:hypothetical protein